MVKTDLTLKQLQQIFACSCLSLRHFLPKSSLPLIWEVGCFNLHFNLTVFQLDKHLTANSMFQTLPRLVQYPLNSVKKICCLLQCRTEIYNSAWNMQNIPLNYFLSSFLLSLLHCNLFRLGTVFILHFTW